MSELPFDLEDPPDEPPAGVVQIMAWRLAVRLHRDHAPAVTDPADGGRPGAADVASDPVCRACGARWPCHARRVAERGLLAACGIVRAPGVVPGRPSHDPGHGHWFGRPG